MAGGKPPVRIEKLGHLTYCSNIHPGETWPDVQLQLQRHLPIIKQELSRDAPFGLGLRLSAEAARGLAKPQALGKFKHWLDKQGCYVFTLNGFPYGVFHGESIKEKVYRPDWQQLERVEYTCRLADILADLLPEGVDGSISTVPGAFKADITDYNYRQDIVDTLVATAVHLHRLTERTGKHICLALEPEPGCMLETTDETLAFFREELFTARNMAKFAELVGTSTASVNPLRKYLGVCLDTCHAAVMFEEPLETAQALINADIKIAKLQLTAALAVDSMNLETLQELKAFNDPIYLHQTSVDCAGARTFFLDLPEACAAFQDTAASGRWRCHYHVPVFLEQMGQFHTTSPALARLLKQHSLTPFTEHLEVETYTFDILPKQYRRNKVTDNISRELSWIRTQLQQ